MNFMVIFERTLDLDSFKSSNISLVACDSLIDLVCRTRGGGACDSRRRTPPPLAQTGLSETKKSSAHRGGGVGEV